MAKKELNEMSTTELKKQAQSLKAVAWLLVVLLLIVFCYALYLTVRDREMQILIVIPVALFPIVLALAGNIKKTNAEIAGRDKQ